MIAWAFLSMVVASLEIGVSFFRSDAFRQVFRDLPLLDVYRDVLATFLLYGVMGGAGWLFLSCVSRIRGKKGADFFARNASVFFWTAVLGVYGFWALKTGLFLPALLPRWGLGVATLVWWILAARIARVLKTHIPLRVKQTAAALVVIATLVLPLFPRFPQGEREGSSLPNAVLLSVDTLRLDHLGCYGSSQGLTPSIDRLASQGLRFQNAYAQIPLTAPSFSSILTGLYPRSHGSRENLVPLDRSVETVAQVFQRSGYRTAAFVSGYPLKRSLSGLSRGFDLYQDRFSFFDGFKLLRFLERFGVVELQLERRADRVSRLVEPWIRRQRHDPFFVWIHYYDPHVPYRPPPSSTPEDETLRRLRRHQSHLWSKGEKEIEPHVLEAMATLYAGEVAFVDQDIGRILSFLEREGLKEKTAILFVADHGESFDHDYYFDHGDRLYESCVRIPVILSYPGVVPEGRVSERVIQSIDLAPTLLGLFHLAGEMGEGRNLFQDDPFSDDPSSVFMELKRREGYPTFGDLWALREGPWKMIYSPEGRPPELYHLVEDPGERINRASQNPERVAAMSARLGAWMAGGKDAERSPVSGLSREKLRSLGYLQ